MTQSTSFSTLLAMWHPRDLPVGLQVGSGSGALEHLEHCDRRSSRKQIVEHHLHVGSRYANHAAPPCNFSPSGSELPG